MLNYLFGHMNFKHKKNKVALRKWKRFIKKVQKDKPLELIDIPNSKGTNLLSSFLLRNDLNKLINITNDYDRFTYITNEIVPKFQEYFLSNSSKFIFTSNNFVQLSLLKSVSTLQILLLENNNDYFSIFPFDTPDISLWKKLKPFSLIIHNGTEYTTDLSKGLITFSSFLPDFMVFGIDIITLLMQYSKLCIMKKEQLNINTYIKQYCILPLEYDLKNIWLYNIVLNIIGEMKDVNNSIGPYLNEYLHSSIKTQFIDLNNSRYNSINAELNNSIDEIIKLIFDCNIGNIYPDSALYSIPLIGYSSIVEYIIEINNRFNNSLLANKMWITFLKDFSFVDLIIKTFSLVPTSNQTKDMILYFEPIMRKYNSNRFWEKIKSPELKKFAKNKMKEIELTIKNIE